MPAQSWWAFLLARKNPQVKISLSVEEVSFESASHQFVFLVRPTVLFQIRSSAAFVFWHLVFAL